MEFEIEEQKAHGATAAFVLYGNDYIEVHKITNGKMKEGKPISIKAIEELKQVVNNIDTNESMSIKGFIDNRILYINTEVGSNTIAWYTKESSRKLYFIGKDAYPKSVPPLLFVWKENQLYVATIGRYGNTVPMLMLPIYKSLFPNQTNLNGGVCLGNVELPDRYESFDEVIQHLENAFFNSYFTGWDTEEFSFWKEILDGTKSLIDIKLKRHEKAKNIKEYIELICK